MNAKDDVWYQVEYDRGVIESHCTLDEARKLVRIWRRRIPREFTVKIFRCDSMGGYSLVE